MIMVPAFFLGALIGVFRSYLRQGGTLDMFQYAAVYGIAFFILGLFLTIALDWLNWI